MIPKEWYKGGYIDMLIWYLFSFSKGNESLIFV